ncbi:gamma-mobile-trio protein GmtX [Pseudomonas koreensis]|jgi:hypothetical protein|uniref:gamma-mobile-trio protein GmtX n=1 Tax=Pseudomonas koreensis TaxID=198620 RepID=UPI001FF0B3BB|nr:gamma-mobile-trio protein GmtX [Pseudomonas koreensis]
MMNGKTDVHPDLVLQTLLAKSGRSSRRANLMKIHELCRMEQETGSCDFSLPNMGRLAEAAGILKGRILYNAQSADYKVLLQTWEAYAGPASPKSPSPLASHQYLRRIEDPALRSIVQAIIAERDKLKAQLNVLKANTQVIVDRRPQGATLAVSPGSPPVAVLALSAQLTLSEREALQKSISPEYLEERGLQEGSHGEIVNHQGRVLFEVGFARAIRKVLLD